MIQDGQKIVLDAFTNFKFMMGEKCRFSKLMKWIMENQNDVHFVHKGTVSLEYSADSRIIFKPLTYARTYGKQLIRD